MAVLRADDRPPVAGTARNLPPKSAAHKYLWLWEWADACSASTTHRLSEVRPKRWLVECTFGWLDRCRRLAKDFENRSGVAQAFPRLAMIRLMLHKAARLGKS